MIHTINACGSFNKINLNQRCSNATKNVSGFSSIIAFNNNSNLNTNDRAINSNNKSCKINSRKNNSSSYNNSGHLSEYDKKKNQIIFEMDEYQYKHIQKYDSRKETKCAICLNDFIGIDIIKAFYKCEHIFHKDCLLNWLKKSDLCPLCKHSLKDDIK